MAADPNPPESITLLGDPIVEEARRRFDRCAEWESQARQRFMDDIRFANGDSENGYQWPNAIRQARDTDSRPCLTMNIVKQHNRMISNEARKNKSSPKFIGMGNGATQESANVFGDIYRHIEAQSQAQIAYSIARDFQIDAGIGWWRLVTDWVSEDSFEQEIFIRPVNDPLSVYSDPDCQLTRTCLDAKFAIVFDEVPRDEFDEAYPKYKGLATQQPLGVSSTNDDWVVKKVVRIAEYFRKVPKEDRLVSFVNRGERHTIRYSRLARMLQDESKLASIVDHPQSRIRDVMDWEVEWYLIAGEQIIDRTIWLGRYIPLIPCKGDETVIDGLLDRKGHTRYLKDAQRMYNYNSALSLNTKIPTPTGWTTIGLLRDGDWIFDQDGCPVQIKKMMPIKVGEPCFKITFDTGHTITTDAGHIWKVEERGKRKAATFEWKDRTICTAELIAKKHFIKIGGYLKLDEVDLSIDPYLLGLWLGDGSTDSPRIATHVDDVEEERQILAELGYATGEPNSFEGKGCSFTVLGVRRKFAEMGLLGEKFVPIAYLRASRNQRLALLQGLLDSDGHFASAVNQCIFVNGDPLIVRAFLELCASLEIKATVDRQPGHAMQVNNGPLYLAKESFRVQFTADPDVPLFRLSRKASLQTAGRPTHWRRTKRIGIVSIEPVESEPVRCLALDTPEHLYLCGEGMIPTHNSAQVEFVALQGKTPWIGPAKAIEGFESMWNTANTVNHSYLPYHHLDPESGSEVAIPPPTRTQPPTASPAYEAGMQTAFTQMMMTSGQWQNQMGMMGNERTGAAINARQRQSDTATFHFQDYYEEALVATGQQIIDLVPKVYDTKRLMKIMAEDGVEYELEINPGARQAYLQQIGHQGEVIKRVFNPQIGRYDVAPGVGPAYASKREDTREALTLILTQAPALTGLIGDLLMASMDFDKAQEAAARMRRMVPPIALGQGPTQNELKLMAQVQALQTALAKSLERQGKDQVKLVGKDALRDIEAYDAETKRMQALAKMLPTDPEGLKQVIAQLVEDALRTSLESVKAESGSDQEEPVPQEVPPVPGAKKAQDGFYYLADPTRVGKYLRVEPLAMQHRQPGVESA